MYLTHILVLFLFLCAQTYCFNLDTNNPIVFVDPDKRINSTNSSYFGYSVVLFPGSRNNSEKWIKIGAPRGQDPKMKNFKNPGVVYNCPYMKECNTVDIYKGFYAEWDVLNNSWIGGTMDISYKSEMLAICNFRRILTSGRNDKSRDFNIQGSCFLSHLNESYYMIELPAKLIHNKQVYLYGQAEYGFSAHFPDANRQLVLGAPGTYNWAGTAVSVAEMEYDDPIPSRRISGRKKRYLDHKVVVGNAIKSTVNEVYDLFGYAIASGYFYGDRRLYYVATTPRASSYRGKVVIFQFNGVDALREKESKVGLQFGEYFGASVTSGDINNDGLEDLFVGAPFHAVNTYNEGCVYIFLGAKNILKSNGKLTGQYTKGQFGSAIMFLGDINQDGYGDIAIGAPYEEEFSGVLYIYKGNNRGLDTDYSQRIVGKDISQEIRGFGISISRPADMDGNGMKDLAVGAHLSANAVLLRSKPIIVINYDMRPIPNELKQETKNFSIEICYHYTQYKDKSIDIKRRVVVDEVMNRAKISNKSQEVMVVTLLKNGSVCENVTISVKDTTNYVAPITVSLSYELVNPAQKKKVLYISDKILGDDMFCLRCPRLDISRSSRPSTIDVPFSLGCGPNVCESNLSIDVRIPSLEWENKFVVGSLDYVNLVATVTNTGENAYSTQLEITLPNVIFFRKIGSNCEERNISVIICNVDNPLQKDHKNTIELDLDMKNLNKNNFEQELNILLRVTTTSKNNNSDWNIFTIKLETLADIAIYGKSEEQSLPFGNATYGMPNFTHIYQVEKIGVSPLEKVLVNIRIPYAIRTQNTNITFLKLYQPKAVFAGQPLMCTSDFTYILDLKMTGNSEKLSYDNLENKRRRRQVDVFKGTTTTTARSGDIKINDKEYEIIPNRTQFINCSTDDVICSSVLCLFGPFEERDAGSIVIKMMFDAQAISGLMGTKNFILLSTHGSVTIESLPGFVQSGNRPDSADVSTVFVNETTTKLAFWIIVVSVIFGVLLLVLIIFGLMKVGFFKRSKKEELENLKAQHATEVCINNEIDDSNEEILESPMMSSSKEGLVEE